MESTRTSFLFLAEQYATSCLSIPLFLELGLFWTFDCYGSQLWKLLCQCPSLCYLEYTCYLFILSSFFPFLSLFFLTRTVSYWSYSIFCFHQQCIPKYSYFTFSQTPVHVSIIKTISVAQNGILLWLQIMFPNDKWEWASISFMHPLAILTSWKTVILLPIFF